MTSPEREATPDDAPCYYAADAASAWANGYNACLALTRAPSTVGVEVRDALAEVLELFDSEGRLFCSGDHQLDVLKRARTAYLSPTLASEKEGGKSVQAASSASATECDHRSTERAELLAVIVDNVKERIAEGDGFWRTCSGCHETENGYDVGRYPFSDVFDCTLGGGCSECGGIGAVWDTTDYGAMADELAAEMNAGQVIANQENLHGSQPESPASLIANGEGESDPLHDTRNPNVLREQRGWGTMTTSQSESNTGDQAGSKVR